MTYLLDTDTCIYLMNGRYPQVERRLHQNLPDAVVLSSIVVSELRFGASNSANPEHNHTTLDFFVSGFEVLAYDNHATTVYGEIRAFLGRRRTPIGSTDMFIAAHALASDLVLVTNNEREFERIPQLRIENWALP